jgi:hypothetical protein
MSLFPFALDANFSWGTKRKLSGSEGDAQRAWIVAGTVEAKNDFGIIHTKEYAVTVIFEGGDRWTPLLVNYDGRIVGGNLDRMKEMEAANTIAAAAAAAAEAQSQKALPSPTPIARAVPVAIPSPTGPPPFRFATAEKPWQAVREWTVDRKKVTGQLRTWVMPAGGKLVDSTGKEFDVSLGSLSKDDVGWIGLNFRN